MSNQVNLETASQLFEDSVTQKFQNEQRLQGAVEERHGTTGVATNVPVSDIIDMSLQGFSPSDILVTPVDNTNVMVVPYNYVLKTAIGGGQRTLFAYDLIMDHSKNHAKAAGRMVDYIKINALFNYSGLGSVYTVPKTVGATSGMNAAKLTKGLGYLEGQGVDVMDHRTSLWLPAATKNSLLNDERVVSEFYNNRKPLVDNVMNSYLGIDIRTLGGNGLNSIPYTSNAGTDTYLVPLVAKDSMVQIFNRDVQTSITWIANNDRYELLTVLTSGAKVIQSNGIALLTCDNPFAANP